MAFTGRPGHKIEFWLRLADFFKPRNEQIRNVFNDLLKALKDWYLTGKCPYITERDDKLEKLRAVLEMIQNNPETTPEETIDLQNKINQLRYERKAVLLWLQMSDPERIDVCRIFDRENYFDGHLMETLLLRLLEEVEKVQKRPSDQDLRKFEESFKD
ncbi:hypothetical protein BHE90_003214 [Fusarium euwallaceae]|uniref:Uncharacterized protein n=3 Tax=Fusarium solani species complex TaxID=232080 RepID=A0A3M2RP12_9HYPO|nr:hypothetical protein CDV36_013338 [Fusarium kuroshium]RSL81515.1 hypothetical protein CEP51_005789 [Fusarium floridanum]RTE82229.1 hypothetical protein BHE90_003214 [Fusarium euwallaceae]